MLEIKLAEFTALETANLILRKMTYEDTDTFFELRSDEYVLAFIQKNKPANKVEITNLIATINKEFDANNAFTFAITKKKDNSLIGTIGFWRIDKQNHRAEIGYALKTQFHRQGIMQEAIEACIQFGFTQLHLHSIEANILPNNEGSRKLLTNAGFEQEAYFKENYYFDGKFYDSVILSLLKK
jgi:[ribosomal protein S5]-alanine N-acetyltransferase